MRSRRIYLCFVEPRACSTAALYYSNPIYHSIATRHKLLSPKDLVSHYTLGVSACICHEARPVLAHVLGDNVDNCAVKMRN